MNKNRKKLLNLQNIPVKTKNGYKVRKLLIKHCDKQMLSIDYSEIELRTMAHLSKNKKSTE